jgi:hypothetical protein
LITRVESISATKPYTSYFAAAVMKSLPELTARDNVMADFDNYRYLGSRCTSTPAVMAVR